jgi:hypothetical protein
MHIKLLSASCNFRQSKVNALNNNSAASKRPCVNGGRETRWVCVCEHITFSSPLTHTSWESRKKSVHKIFTPPCTFSAHGYAPPAKEKIYCWLAGDAAHAARGRRFEYKFYSRTTLNSNGIFMVLHIVVLMASHYSWRQVLKGLSDFHKSSPRMCAKFDKILKLNRNCI